ncbi:MAG: nucleotide sugar dehydrogenase, partial [Planctomycetia bacterium]|nr:nucleotide sugar dehydrogenase [Planctomycetia bacterium]
MSDEVFSRLEKAIAQKTLTLGVMGLGYVGLPLIRAFSRVGIRTVGFDVDPEKVRKLLAGESYIHHIDAAWIREMVGSGLFEPTADMDRLSEPDAVLICVPTPLNETRDPDMQYVVSTAEEISRRLRPGQLIVLESTTYPGTTRDVMVPILERSGLKAGTDFFVAFSPEREDPGNPDYSAQSIPKIVGGLDERSGRIATLLYSHAVVKAIQVSNCDVAEAAKILENTYRCVNIALV